MEDILIQQLKQLVSQFPDSEFRVEYFDNNSHRLKVLTNEDFRVQT